MPRRRLRYYYIDFNPWTHHFDATQSSGGIIQTFCGHITNQNLMYFDDPCDRLFGINCPAFIRPSNIIRFGIASSG